MSPRLHGSAKPHVKTPRNPGRLTDGRTRLLPSR
jgi:hypothetical protein